MSIPLPDADITGSLMQVPAGLNDQLYQVVTRPDVADLTSGSVGGPGIFDTIMASVNSHLKSEYEKGRITGAHYTEAYIALTQAAMATSLQFLMSRDVSFWQAQQAQVGAVTGKVALETARVTYTTAKYNLDNLLPEQLATAQQQRGLVTAQKASAEYSVVNILPAQASLVREQAEAQRAQTGDVRIDGTSISGVSKRQRDLYEQQIASYKRDSENKAAKLFTDAFITMKTIDEGLSPPGNFTNATFDIVLDKLRTNNGLV